MTKKITKKNSSAKAPGEKKAPGPAWAHPTAMVDEGASVGLGTKIWHFCHVMAGARIGTGCSLGQNVFVGGLAIIGNGCKIQNNVSVYDRVEIEDDVFVGPSAVFTNVINPRAFVVRKTEYQPTVVGQGASIGANATIICGQRIGAFAFVAAGAVVTRDVPAYALMAGVPARRIGWICQCGTTLRAGTTRSRAPKALHCVACQLRYRIAGAAAAARLLPVR